MPKNKNLNQWQKFIAEVRTWDRQEHNWYETMKKHGSMPTKNLVSKNAFIHLLMKKYNLSKRS
jgi:hypothetical protein